VNGASDPRQNGLWADALVKARQAVEDHSPHALTAHEADRIAEAVTDALLTDFLAFAEASSWVAFLPDGIGPVCTWCGRMPGPKLPTGHPQAGVFCQCRRAPEAPGDGT